MVENQSAVRTRLSPTLEEDIERARKLAVIMDSQFSVFGIEFGADAILGLVPGIGDTVTLLPALYPVYLARRHGLGRALVLRMGWNLALDWAIGLIPLVGDALDVASKANLKNVELLSKAAKRRDKSA